MISNLNGWTGIHSRIALFYTLAVCFVTLAYFNIDAVHPVWFVIILSISFWYFSTLSIFLKRWEKITTKKFEQRLFWHSMLYRVITSIVLITVAYIEWGRPDYVGAVDAINFHEQAIIIAEHYRNFDFSGAYTTARSFYFGIDNIGPALFIGFIFAIFADSYFMATVVLAVLGCISVVLLYRTGKLIWDEQIGRTAGIMFMHFPLSLFFSVVIMKEGVVLFLLMVVVYLLTKAVNGQRLTTTHIIVLIFSLFSLFFFRTVVGLILVVLVSGTLLLNKYKGSRIKSWSIGSIAIILFGLIMYSLGEYQFFIDRFLGADRVGDQRIASIGLEAVGLDHFSFKDFILAPIGVLLSFIPPFPGMVEASLRYGTSHDMNYYYMPGLIIWNIFAFFSLIGFYHSVKEKFFNSMPVWGFSLAYALALSVTFLFTRVRFAYLGMPLLIILAAVGIYKIKNKQFWILYLGGLIAVTIVWNTFRLGIRGL